MDTGAQRVVEAAAALRHLLAGFEPERYAATDCAILVEALAQTAKACDAARLLAAARAVANGVHKESGVSDPARWVANHTGMTRRDANDGLAMASSLERFSATKEALLAGELSVAQAKEITGAAAEIPDSEGDLLAVARGADLTKLRDEVRERRIAAFPVADLHRRQLAARRFRHWRDGLGMVCFEGALPPQTGIPFVARIEHEAARRHRDAKRAGRNERFWSSAADALVALTTNSGEARKHAANADLVIVCDLFAFRRGHAHEGEHCHIVGGGPVPVPLAKAMADDAFLKIVLHDGKEIQRILHVGRRMTAELRSALELGPVPAFNGKACIDCGRRGPGLELDHLDPIANHGVTSYANLKARCYLCHQDKTERDRVAGRLGRGRATGDQPAPSRKQIAMPPRGGTNTWSRRGQPPTCPLPSDLPPTGQPPTGQTPAGQPPAGQPPAGQPPTGPP